MLKLKIVQDYHIMKISIMNYHISMGNHFQLCRREIRHHHGFLIAQLLNACYAIFHSHSLFDAITVDPVVYVFVRIVHLRRNLIFLGIAQNPVDNATTAPTKTDLLWLWTPFYHLFLLYPIPHLMINS